LLAPDDAVADRLGIRTAAAALRGVTLRQLLEHTHGLDDSRLDVVPRTRNGFIDTQRLLRAVTVHARIAPPGAVYSYGCAGAGLMAAALEKRLHRSYGQSLRDEVLTRAGIDSRGGFGMACPAVCPATGDALALSASDVLRVIERAIAEGRDAWPTEHGVGTYGAITPLPGWNPLERGVYLGWKHCGHGWFGHQSVWPGASIFARGHPARRVALVVTSRDESAALLAARLFGSALPELFDPRIPLRGTSVDLERCAGRYASAAWTVDVEVAHGQLEITVGGWANPRIERAGLRAVADGLFFRIGACRDRFPYVQFVGGERSGGSTYLWNGQFVLPRVSAP
jgi:hypothetical protein